MAGETQPERKDFDLDGYIDRIQKGPCFICDMVAGRLNGNHVITQNDLYIAFMNIYTPLYGYALVAPTAHKEQVTGDFSQDEYLALQGAVYRVAEAVRRTVACERVYILSLGSQQGNSHVHWHIAPLPHGVPFEAQQLAALTIESGILDISDDEMAALARRIRRHIGG